MPKSTPKTYPELLDYITRSIERNIRRLRECAEHDPDNNEQAREMLTKTIRVITKMKWKDEDAS
jgi:hypothetical protein